MELSQETITMVTLDYRLIKISPKFESKIQLRLVYIVIFIL